jgi:hypothetical protein
MLNHFLTMVLDQDSFFHTNKIKHKIRTGHRSCWCVVTYPVLGWSLISHRLSASSCSSRDSPPPFSKPPNSSSPLSSPSRTVVYPRAKGGTDSSSPLPFYPLFWEEGSRKKPEFLRTASRQQLKSSKNPAHHPKRRGEGIDGRGTNEAGTSIG